MHKDVTNDELNKYQAMVYGNYKDWLITIWLKIFLKNMKIIFLKKKTTEITPLALALISILVAKISLSSSL